MSQSEERTRSVVIEKFFECAPEKLWRALTEPALLTQWLLSNNFLPHIGREFQFRTEPVGRWDGVIDCKVLALDPLKRLVYSWRAFGHESTVGFTLTPSDGGTQLRMEHSGFRVNQKAAFQGAQHGWERFIENLERLLDAESNEKIKGSRHRVLDIDGVVVPGNVLHCILEWFTPQAAQAFARLGFPAASFRVEHSAAKMLGVLVLLIPAIPARVKEWACAGFTFNLVSALIAHAAIHDQHVAFAPSTISSCWEFARMYCGVAHRDRGIARVASAGFASLDTQLSRNADDGSLADF